MKGWLEKKVLRAILHLKMKFLLSIFLVLCFSLEGVFFDEEDPSLYHHVNVINGQLNLNLIDDVIQGPVAFPLMRSYTSGGAFERCLRNSDLVLRDLRGSGWMVQGGWSLLPHTQLLVQRIWDCKCVESQSRGTVSFEDSQPPDSCFLFHLREKTGQLITYRCKNNAKKKFFPNCEEKKVSGNISARENFQNSFFEVEGKKATLSLANGGKRYYSEKDSYKRVESFWTLDLEVLPSKHRIVYFYSSPTQKLSRIELQNPRGTKVFATAYFNEDETVLQVTSLGSTVAYEVTTHKERSYLKNVSSRFRESEIYHYEPGRKSLGARLNCVEFGGKSSFIAKYNLPKTKKKEKKWINPWKKKPVDLDKVRVLQMPNPEDGALVDFANLSYEEDYTDIRDVEGILTRYHHDDGLLHCVEYFDRESKRHSYCNFQWENQHLIGKELRDSEDTLLFAKRFLHDKMGNVIEEYVIEGTSCESMLHRCYTYYPDSYLLRAEEEVGGLLVQYEYLSDTDLITKKLTLSQGVVHLREFFFYDEDNILVHSLKDDGKAQSAEDVSGITHRFITRFVVNEKTGLCNSESHFYLDLNTKQEKLLRRYSYQYNEKREKIAESIYDERGEYRFTLYTEYDQYGRLIMRSTPQGRRNLYSYDSAGQLIFSKEIGSQAQSYIYDFSGQAKARVQGDKTTQNIYDIKGRLKTEIDHKKNVTLQEFDSFGKCALIQYPSVLDQQGVSYIPSVEFSYDIQGNLQSHANDLGHTIYTEYNYLRKPILVRNPDGLEVRHKYFSNGALESTLEVDGTKVSYTYDSFQRMTSKTIRSDQDEILSEEFWKYNAFELLSYTDPNGTRTQYEYDDAGRKRMEITEKRKTKYFYDPLGNTEKVTSSTGASQVFLHNEEGEIIEQWQEDFSGRRENHMIFFYDQEGRKEKATRCTPKGKAEDQFFYDKEGRLIRHIDPLGEKTEFIFLEVTNSLDQRVDQKKIIDPLGNMAVESFDAGGRLVQLEKLEPGGLTVSKEEYFYDKGGNQSKRITTVFENQSPIRTHTTEWEYNCRGWIEKEIEEGCKETAYFYDAKGRLLEEILPSKVVISRRYDGLGRLLEVQSSDETVHNTYEYDRTSKPIVAIDHTRNFSWERRYDAFGNLLSEYSPNSSQSFWEYDDAGRCAKYTLPNGSSVQYIYDSLHLRTINRVDPNGDILYSHNYQRFDENGHVHEEELIHQLGTIHTEHDLLERPEKQSSPYLMQSASYGPTGLVTGSENSLFSHKEYTYDPLSQLQHEGEKTHCFDSLGNSLDDQVNQFNQIIANAECKLFYDDSGNPIRQHFSDKAIAFSYDAFNRLTSIQEAGQKRVNYVYDPFSRLYAKESYILKTTEAQRTKKYYLYDHEAEIGTYDEQKNLVDFKVLGLGIQGEIGATIALELLGETFAPLHDFNGNIIALISTDGYLREKTDVDAFGKNLAQTPSINPWRFNSKREEEHLIFFGKRFYDPQLGRWLNPDPVGSFDSPNLYLYARNTPLNRLDLFGLYSDEFYTEFSISQIRTNGLALYHARSFLGEIQADWVICSNQFHKLDFSPEELQTGKTDLIHHLQEIIPKEGMIISLVTCQGGIDTTLKQFEDFVLSTAETTPGDVTIIGFHNPTNGIVSDVNRTFGEMSGKENASTAITRQSLLAVAETIRKINPNALFLQIAHSEAGAINDTAIKGMNKDERDLIYDSMLWMGAAPALPLAKEYARESDNFYSKQDGVTQLFGLFHHKHPVALSTCGLSGLLLPFENKDYNIEFLPCTSKWSERSGYTFDHAYMGNTLKNKREGISRDYDKKYGFYRASSR